MGVHFICEKDENFHVVKNMMNTNEVILHVNNIIDDYFSLVILQHYSFVHVINHFFKWTSMFSNALYAMEIYQVSHCEQEFLKELYS